MANMTAQKATIVGQIVGYTMPQGQRFPVCTAIHHIELWDGQPHDIFEHTLTSMTGVQFVSTEEEADQITYLVTFRFDNRPSLRFVDIANRVQLLANRCWGKVHNAELRLA